MIAPPEQIWHFIIIVQHQRLLSQYLKLRQTALTLCRSVAWLKAPPKLRRD